jgi:hypothetical protein
LSTPPSLCIASEAGFMGVWRTETALCEIDAPFRLAVVSGIGDRQLLERFTVPSDSDGGVQLWDVVTGDCLKMQLPRYLFRRTAR